MLYFNRFLKLFIFLVTVALLSYTGLWFYSSYKIKQLISGNFTEFDNELKLSHDKIDVTGFPFKIRADIDNLVINYKSDKIKLESISTYQKVTLETDLLFKSLKIKVLGKSESETSFADKVTILDSIYKDGCYITLTSDSSNIIKVIKALYNKEALNDIQLSQASFATDNVITFDRATKTEISKGSTDLKVSFDRPSDKITNTFIKLDAQADVPPEGKQLFSDLINSLPLSKLLIKADIDHSSKKLEDGTSITSFLNIKPLEIVLDESIFTVNAKITNDDKGETIFNINLKATNWDSFIQALVNEKIISLERYDAIIELFSEIEGDDFSKEELNFTLSNKSGFMTLDDKPLHSLSKSFDKLSKSK
ncbi:MAG: hypothetical protein N4A31_04060 [Rickettsiales bacterium]|jgi:hypothetical protein|nr:hypothetical protein [Rickettsiales bacterium]